MIEVRNVTKRFGTTVAVDDLSFTVRPGMVTGFLGPNGAGKSTTMRVILGLDRPTSGTALINGRPFATHPAPLRQVGALLDAGAVHGARSARQHLRWQARAGGIASSRVDDVLDIVGLTDAAGRRVKGFSLGMLQRLGIAGALLGDPPILMFDEPVTGLDPEGIRWVRTFMRRLAAEGRIVLVSSHLMSEMEGTADHVVVIGRGRLIADTPMAEFIARSTGSHVRVVSPQAADLARLLENAGADVSASDTELLVTGLEAARIGELAAERGVVLHELTSRHATLEAAFLELTGDAVEYHAREEPGS
ncbi:MAG TPA: ATP-binding cassette domain-containing protein [Candidatus Angelobacter sp.]|nr:ATP-binding cassette domain-containing protein [Candidatus Angelobacter sp.]